MNIYSRIVLILLSILSTTFATLNGKCTGRNGICINTGTCNSYGGQIYSGKCPGDPENVKCCDEIPCSSGGKKGKCMYTNQCSGQIAIGKCPGNSDFRCCIDGDSDETYNGPCYGGGGACINVNKVTCETGLVNGKCPGDSNIKCCVSGSRPSWYINQIEHPDVICQGDSVRNAGCGISSLSMGIQILTKAYVSPETLFREACQQGMYYGEGFGHDELVYLGKKHGVRLNWVSSADTAYNALVNGKGVIFHVKYDDVYRFTHGGHYIFLYGAKTQNGVKKVYVFDPNGSNNYINVLFALKRSDDGIELAQKGTSVDFGILEKL